MLDDFLGDENQRLLPSTHTPSTGYVTYDIMHGLSLAKLKPLLVGRLTRIAFGLGAFAWIWVGSPSWIGSVVLAVLGLSFVMGGLVANPGCEITAIPNVFLPARRRLHSL